MNEYTWLPFPSPTLGSGSDPRRRRALSEFLTGPENRLAETAVRLVLGGVPFFADSPLSDSLSNKVQGKKTPRPSARREGEFGRAAFDWRLPPPRRGDGTLAKVIDYMPPANLPDLFPVVFYGPSGCGKTQLAGGISHELRRRDPQAEGVFLGGEQFYRSLSDAIHQNRAEELRGYFSRCRYLIFDNVDELEEHPAGAAELLALLRTVRETGAAVILTLSRHPDLISAFPAALRARLAGGLAVPLAFPSRAGRALLLRRYAEVFRVKLLESTEKFLLDTLPEPPGEMYAVFEQLYHEHRWSETLPDPEKIKRFLDKRRTRAPLTLEAIAKAAARAYAVKLSDLRSNTRRKTVVTARNMTLLIARESMEVTLQELGRYFAGRDHSTILHGIRTIAKKMEIDDELKLQHERIVGELDKIVKTG